MQLYCLLSMEYITYIDLLDMYNNKWCNHQCDNNTVVHITDILFHLDWKIDLYNTMNIIKQSK